MDDLPTFGASVKKVPLEFAALAILKATASTPFKILLASTAVKPFKKSLLQVFSTKFFDGHKTASLERCRSVVASPPRTAI